jgi:hypothetical protein
MNTPLTPEQAARIRYLFEALMGLVEWDPGLHYGADPRTQHGYVSGPVSGLGEIRLDHVHEENRDWKSHLQGLTGYKIATVSRAAPDRPGHDGLGYLVLRIGESNVVVPTEGLRRIVTQTVRTALGPVLQELTVEGRQAALFREQRRNARRIQTQKYQQRRR